MFQFHDASASFFCLQNFRGRKVSGPSTKASSCMTPLMNPRAKASTRTQRAQSAPDCGRASCPRMTTGPLMSTTSRGSGTGSPSQRWQVRNQRPCSEAALTHAGQWPWVKGVSALSLPAQISQGLHWAVQLGCPCFCVSRAPQKREFWRGGRPDPEEILGLSSSLPSLHGRPS